MFARFVGALPVAWITIILLASSALADAGTPTLPSPPTQPATGPGSSQTSFDQVIATHVTDPAPGYWEFTPAKPHPGVNLATVPVVVFLGGCCMPDRTNLVVDFYRDWIDHIVRRGAIVFYPTYPSDFGITVDTFMRHASTLPPGPNLPRPDWSKLSLVAHSFGGVVAVDYAESAGIPTLPVPRVLMLAMPGCLGCYLPDDLDNVSDATRVIVMVGTDDTVVGSAGAQTIFHELAHIPASQRDYVIVSSDHHGSPPLLANHALPTTTNSIDGGAGRVDAFDWYGTWKLTDALMSCSFAGKDCDYALGNTANQRNMGTWSDGVPVKQLVVTEDPGTPTP
jgi:hypothetical protein